ncbi:MAG: hypothetical protein RLY57_296 [Candidatus Parcubacteria bacterium]|jgi:hypothetical protein
MIDEQQAKDDIETLDKKLDELIEMSKKAESIADAVELEIDVPDEEPVEEGEIDPEEKLDDDLNEAILEFAPKEEDDSEDITK